MKALHRILNIKASNQIIYQEEKEEISESHSTSLSSSTSSTESIEEVFNNENNNDINNNIIIDITTSNLEESYKDIDDILKYFNSPITLLTHKLLFLLWPTVSWQPQILILTNENIFLFEVQNTTTILSRCISLNTIMGIKLLLGHNEGTALISCIRHEHDLIVKAYPNSLLSIEELTHAILRENKNIFIDEVNISNSKGSLRSLLKNRDLRPPLNCPLIIKERELLHNKFCDNFKLSTESTELQKKKYDDKEEEEEEEEENSNEVESKNDNNNIMDNNYSNYINDYQQEQEQNLPDENVLFIETANSNSKRNNNRSTSEVSLLLKNVKISLLSDNSSKKDKINQNSLHLMDFSVDITNKNVEKALFKSHYPIISSSSSSSFSSKKISQRILPPLIPYLKADKVALWAREVPNPLSWLDNSSIWIIVRFQLKKDVMICIGNTSFVHLVRLIMSNNNLNNFSKHDKKENTNKIEEEEDVYSETLICDFYSFGLSIKISFNETEILEPCFGNTMQVQNILCNVASVPFIKLLSHSISKEISHYEADGIARIRNNSVYCRIEGYRWFEIPLPMLIEDWV